MARLPLPGEELTGRSAGAPEAARQVPPGALAIAERLRAAGHQAHLVGGCVRDLARGLAPDDWDLTTDASPERLQALFPAARYENRFGTVLIEASGDLFEVTAWRRESTYSDHRRPDAIEPAGSLRNDLARRDFTVNAMACAIDGEGFAAQVARAPRARIAPGRFCP